MKLDQSMVGRKVKGVQWPNGEWFHIEWGRANLFAGYTSEGAQHAYKSDEYCWELVESPKLPSERIRELELSTPDGDILPGRTSTDTAIIKYLDEQAGKWRG